MWSALQLCTDGAPEKPEFVLSVRRVYELACRLGCDRPLDHPTKAYIVELMRIALERPDVVPGWRITRDATTRKLRLLCTRTDAPRLAPDEISTAAS